MFHHNVPDVKLGIVAVSRDCFPMELSENRRKAVVQTYHQQQKELYECSVVVENECDAIKAVEELKANEVNAMVVYLGNFGPETPETILAQRFGGPVMYVAAAEETQENLIDGRGDAYCGMLNASYNLGLRQIKAYIPEYPVGTAVEICAMMDDFVPVARTILGLRGLKLICFGPRPNDFLACNAPIKKLFDLGVEIEENSELDLLAAVKAHDNDPRIPQVVADMEQELGGGNKMPTLLPKLAQFEITLLDWAESHKGSRQYVAFANKCWPAFQTEFGFCPCYVNGRLTGRGIPVACEVDIYGALSEYIGLCASGEIVTLLDINNSVPSDMYLTSIKDVYPYTLKDTFMGFHCGNTNASKLSQYEMKYQLIQHRCLEPDSEPNVSRGTLEGDLKPGEITFFRLQSTADSQLKAYVAEGEILPVPTRSFGGIGVFAIPEMARFYRHVLIAKRYPHHGAVAFGHYGKVLFDVLSYLGVDDIAYNQPKGVLYPTENPFEAK